jgi:uncharacterized protein (DUF608 family)
MGKAFPVMAGPFLVDDFENLVPADKKLSETWVRSLFERGVADWYSGEDLKHIGMPVGGICCGHVYLGGDGRLWHWDIFNQGIRTGYRGPHYAEPMAMDTGIDLGFTIRTRSGGKDMVRLLDKTGFPNIRFRGAYPIGFVEYGDDGFPLEVSLEAFSPFSPLEVDDSSLPLTVMRYTVRNVSKNKVEVALAGQMTNPVLQHSGNDNEGKYVNTLRRRQGATCIHYTVEKTAPGDDGEERADMGDMTLAILDHGAAVFAVAGLSEDSEEGLFAAGPETARSSSDIRPIGAVGKSLSLAPGEETTVSFAVAWRFANHPAPVGKGHYYAERFDSSLAAVDYLTKRYDNFYTRTRSWHDTWYDSTLPHWLLDRTFVNTSTLATSTCMRLEGGRFYAWEGVGCCAGTCSHVWHYAQSVGRIFPELERITREGVDYGLSYQPDGSIWYRADIDQPEARHEAIDGQCGTILRVYREHTMSPNDAFLRRIWPRVKGSIQYLIKQDGDGSGVLEGKQMNTLDAAWYGPISWLSSLYIGALRAGSAMAREMGDEAFATKCDTLAKRGGKWVSENLFDGEYFYQKRDPAHPEAFGSGIGCHIDQVFGQGWAHQLGLERVLPKDKTQSALKALWRYNFTPDVGPYREEYQTGRWYAMPGEAGLIMCTFPKGGEREARGDKPTHGFAGYFNECMNGFEYQAAGHMIAEGLVQQGLAVTRAVHDRYHPSRRNPYNEIECGDHYARSMASHGVFVSVCGFEHHGPKGHIGFSPRLTPEDFRSGFIAAEGWGTFAQKRDDRLQTETLRLKFGQLNLNQMAFDLAEGKRATGVEVKLDGNVLEVNQHMVENRVFINLVQTTTVKADQVLEIEIST